MAGRTGAQQALGTAVQVGIAAAGRRPQPPPQVGRDAGDVAEEVLAAAYSGKAS